MCYLEAERGLREPLTKSWCYSSVVGWILISTRGPWCFALQCWHSVRNFSSALHSNLTGDFQPFIRQQFMMMILPSSIRRYFVFSFVVTPPICLKSPFSDQFPCLNLWGVCVCTPDWIGVKLFSRQCDSVSRRCFSAKQKINIYWQGSEGIFFCLVASVSILLQGRGTHRARFIHLESKSSSSSSVFDNLPLGTRLWTTNPHGQ